MFEITQSKEERKENKKSEESWGNLGDIIKGKNLHIRESPEEEERDKNTGRLIKK